MGRGSAFCFSVLVILVQVCGEVTFSLRTKRLRGVERKQAPLTNETTGGIDQGTVS